MSDGKNTDGSQTVVLDCHSKDSPQLALGLEKAACAVSLSPRTLWSLTFPRGPIRPKKVGKRILYPVSELQRFLTDCDDVTADAGVTIQ
jgi:hypothetical protein